MWKKLCVAYFLLLLPHLVVELDKLSEELPFLLEWIGLSGAHGHFPNPPKDNAGLVRGNTLAQNLFGKLTKSQIVDLADFYQDGLYLEDIVQMNQI